MRTGFHASNYISFCKDKYDTEELFWKAVSDSIRILIDAGYIVSFKYDDVGVYVLEFDYADEEFGTPYIYWLDSEQSDSLLSSSYMEDKDDET